MSKLLTTLAVALAVSQGVSAACTNPSTRQSWATLSQDEKASYINSTLCLMNPETAPSKTGFAGAKSVWDDLQVAHVAQVQFIHTVGAFLPWHRWYMTVHEGLLRECGFIGPYPYWDEQADQATGSLANSSMWSADPATGVGTATVDENLCVVDGAFTNLRLDLTIELTRTAESTCLQRNFKQQQFDQLSQDIVDSCYAINDYENFNTCLGSTPHVSGHYAVGGTMDDVSLSPGDPMFFLHHTNLDRLWWEWQAANSSRVTDMGGQNVATSFTLKSAQPLSLPEAAFAPYFGDNGNVTTLDHVLWMAGIAENVTIAEVVDINSDAICVAFA
ncbi:hypothetical protein DL95DRAFT_478368 [Leptodontidium sp. 2 PMI_412]|nr:hypothetical protein BKA61DRAFT_682892 [Leptodontidium sp. MPI-SDFR-AT-0119]KAH9209136.1 hypothetical protein DL95DRAFT_478368 [Leptodontidium sp. 2 PMI_412]